MHAVANSAAARFSPAPSASSARYSLSYYLGSSAGGLVLGFAWDQGGWPLAAAGAVALLAMAAAAGAASRPQPAER